uniref:Glycosyltransferase n=1 Tax=viral metagenome TaxID=1070528 RepID=A0A6C0BTS0_9ZZZZ
MIIVKEFIGMLGNNIIQLSNIIDIAIAYKHNIKFNVNHTKFDLNIISEYFHKYDNKEVITNSRNFHYYDRLGFPVEIFEQHVEERNNLLKEAFKIKNVNIIDENNLVIHIRGGDIFSHKPHWAYVPPPLSYYVKQIEKRKYEKIIIVSEDTKNPVINKLQEMYKNVIYNKNNLDVDINIILGATNLVFSVGTFVPALMKMSDNIKYLHGSEFDIEELEEYYKKMKPWNNTEEQRKYIMNYKY